MSLKVEYPTRDDVARQIAALNYRIEKLQNITEQIRCASFELDHIRDITVNEREIIDDSIDAIGKFLDDIRGRQFAKLDKLHLEAEVVGAGVSS